MKNGSGSKGKPVAKKSASSKANLVQVSPKELISRAKGETDAQTKARYKAMEAARTRVAEANQKIKQIDNRPKSDPFTNAIATIASHPSRQRARAELQAAIEKLNRQAKPKAKKK